MKFYLDSANIEEIEKASALPYFAGVTTNPILVEREKIQNRHRFYECILARIPQKELFVQIYSSDPLKAYNEALSLAQISRERIIVKIPLKSDLLEVASRLSNKSIRICITAVSCARQILIASSLGVEYAAIYLNRLLRSGLDGYKEITTAHQIISENKINFRILVASISEERLIDPLLTFNRLDFTLPSTPFLQIPLSRETSEWVKDFDEITDKAVK